MGVLAGTNLDSVTSVDRQNSGSVPDGATASGGAGAAGPPGPPGTGIPTGGAAFQRLAKNTGKAYDTGWYTEPFFFASDYGFSTSGTASANTTALQAALTAAGAAGGGIVLMGAGTYSINHGLTLPQVNGSIVLRGSGNRATWLSVADSGTLFSGGYASQKGVLLEDFGCIYVSQQTTSSFLSYTAGWGLALNRLLVFNCGHFLTLGTDQVGAAFNYLWVTGCNVQGSGGILFNLIGSMGALWLRGNYAQSAQSGSKILTHTGTHTPVITSLFMSESDFEQFYYGILFEYSADGGITDSFFGNLIIGNGITQSHGISFKTALAPAFRVGNVVLENVQVNVSGTNFHAINFDSDYYGSAFGVGAMECRGCVNVGASGGGDGIHVGAATEILVSACQVNSSTIGIHAASSAGFVNVLNNRVGLITGCTTGIQTDSGAAGGMITGNDLRGNSTKLTNNWGANSAGVRYVANNFGVDV